jgi:YVTN family beta-propeller protein
MSTVRPKIATPLEDTDLLKGTRPRASKERVLDIPVSILRDYVREKLAEEYVPLGREITINGVTYDLSEDRAWTISGSSGIDGANSRRWFALNTTKDPITTGYITLRDGVSPLFPVTLDPASVARVSLNISDNTGASMAAWLLALRIYVLSNPGKAYIQITDSSNNGIFGIYQVDSGSIGAGFYSFFVTYISGNGPFTLASEVVVSWVLFGADGASGTPLSLEVDGTPNVDQTLLNLIAGTNTTLTDDGSGGVTIDAAGGSQLNEPTGILFGGNLSASIGGTTFDLTAGIGQIVTQTSTISGVSTTVTPISWAASTAVPITNIATAPFTYVLIDNTGTIIQQTTPFTDAQYKTHIVIGIVCHIDLATVNLVTNTQNVAYQDPYRLVEMIRLFGPIKKTGMVISANGANLRVDRTAGQVFKIGSNYTTAAFEPDVDTISAATPALLCTVYRDGSGGFVFDTNGGSFYTDIDPNQWDDGSGTLQGVPSNRWTIQRLFMFPKNPNDIICYYGINLYNNFSDARAGVEFEQFDEAQITAENAVFLGYLFVRHNATDLSDSNEAAFLQAGLFRGIPPGGGGSGGGGVTSVGLSVPSPTSPAFSVSGSPVTTSGTLAINALGSTSQYVRGDGSLATFPTTPTPIPDVAIYPYQQAVMIIDSSPLTLSAFPSINIVAAPSFGAGNVKLFDAITNEPLITLSVGGAVAAFHIPSINEIWISTLSANTIRRYDDSTFSFIATFANGGNRATEAVIDPVSGYVYTTNLASNSISVIDPTGPSVVTTFASGTIGGTGPKGICYNNNPASAMYQMIVAVLAGTNELCIIDPSTNTVTAININPSGSLSGAQSIAYSETSDQYYVACSTGENVIVLEPLTATTMGFVTSIQGIINAYDIECDQDTGLLYVSFARIQASVVVSHVLLGVIDSALDRLVRVCNTASINTSTTVVYNVAVDSVNGVAYCNGYTGSNSNKFLSKFKIKP